MIDFFLSSFLIYHYWLFFFVMFFASFGFPLPATALVIAGWAFIEQWYFDIWLLFLSWTLGCILWDIFGYWVSYLYGKDIFYRIWLRKILESPQASTFEPIFIRRNISSVFITRFLITWLWPSVNILAGITKMNPASFIMTDIAGEIIYIALILTLGYSFSSQWESILDILESFWIALSTMSLIGIFIYLFWKHSHKVVEKRA